MSPTNDQIVAEAVRRREAVPIEQRLPVEDYVIEVMRENWTPPEPVDPDVLAFREWAAIRWGVKTASAYRLGDCDDTECAAAYLAGARMAQERERERAKALEARLSDLVERVTDNSKKYVFTGINTHEMISARDILAKHNGEA